MEIYTFSYAWVVKQLTSRVFAVQSVGL